MGELADEMAEGMMCCLCGSIFIEGWIDGRQQPVFTHGYPVVCWGCWKGLSKRDRKQYQRALKPTLGGV